MRFGGHETFSVRDGWLHKGLRLVIENPEAYGKNRPQDFLGVGKNMARSIKHWLVATGLAEHAEGKVTRWTPLRPTALGRLVYEHDRHFEHKGTWWALHVNLVNNEAHAASWHWFFNYFNVQRFEKPVCVEGLVRHLEVNRTRMPSARTLDRDISCLLTTYSMVIPRPVRDPEDLRESPFVELGLMTHFRESGYYHVNHSRKDIPPQIFGYALARSLQLDNKGCAERVDIRLIDAVQRIGGPGRCFQLGGEDLFTLLQESIMGADSPYFEITGLAGERAVRIRTIPSLEWLREFYEAKTREDLRVA